jgi:ribosomal protein S18 acetylase RimI-like enzyme
MKAVVIQALTTEAEARACAQVMATSQPWLTLGRDFDACLRTVGAPGRERHVAHINGRLAGFVILNLHGALVGYIQTVGVVAEFRGRGVGTSLVAFAEQRIFSEHANVFMCVSSFNHGARRLYERLGYARVGELTDFLVAGQAEILLRKTRGPILAPAAGAAVLNKGG